LSTKRLGELVKANPERLSVRALSEEAPEVVRAYLKDNAHPFSYLQRLNSHPALAPYLEEVSFLPFVFVFHQGKLIWKGNPTYPKGEFDAVMSGLLTGKGEALQVRESEEQRALKEEIKALQTKTKSLAKNLSAVSATLVERQRRLSELAEPSFMEFDAVFWGLYDTLLLDRIAAGGKLSEAREARYVSEVRVHIERYLTLFKESRDDLIYLTADLYGVEEPSLRQLDLAERALKRLEALRDQEVTYPDYELSLLARSAGERGAWDQALSLIEQAITQARSLKRPESFMKGFFELKEELEAGSRRCEAPLAH
jgi:hypothetical protein